jgi:Pentapeptide repeats (8 copies)
VNKPRLIVTAGAVLGLVGLALWALHSGRTTVILIVLTVAIVLTVLSWSLFKKGNKSFLAWWLGLREADPADTVARELGSSLLTGLIVAVSVLVLQIFLDRAREREALSDQLRLSVALSQDLAGLDAHGSSLSEISLAGKSLDRADLRDADLSDANLEGASLREADLRGADLEAASLYRANLARAKLSGADLDEADLRFAQLAAAEVYAKDGYDVASFEGAEANARTCLPPDIITGTGEVDVGIRGQLEPMKTVVHGRVLDLPDDPDDLSIGYQCPLSFNNLFEDVTQYSEGRTYAELADPWNVHPNRVASLFETPGSVALRRETLIIRGAVCPGETEIVMRRTQWEQGGTFALLVRQPGEPIERTTALSLVTEIGGELIAPRDLGPPLKRGSTVILFATPNAHDQGLDYAFVKRLRIRPCRETAASPRSRP